MKRSLRRESKSQLRKPHLTTRKKLLFSMVATCALFAALELGLRLGGFRFESRVEAMKFTFPLEHFDVANLDQQQLRVLMEQGVPIMQRDPVLFWKPVPNVLGHNSRSVHGPEFEVPKPSGVFRVVCLGDSCTHFGPDSYPSHVQKELQSSHDGKVEVINAGCAGFTSHQGLTRLRTEVGPWEPDVVTVYFGWNDHWVSRGLADREQKPQFLFIHDILMRYRICQLMHAASQKLAPARERPYRVPLDDYADNLRQFHQRCTVTGTTVLFVTAPHALNLGIPEYLTTNGEVADPSHLIELHGRYNDVVRQISAELHVPLVDLDREFDSRDKSKLFIEDHIHLSQEGRALAGKLIAEAIQKQNNPQTK